MDNLKIYAVGPEQLGEPVACMKKTSKVIGMRLEVRKRGTAHMLKGKVLVRPDNPARSEESMRSLE